MKSLSQFINESSKKSIDTDLVKAYFDDIHEGLKKAIDETINQTNNMIDIIGNDLGDNAGVVLDKSQIYGPIIEGLLFKNLNNEVNFTYKQGKENSSDKHFICTKVGLDNELTNGLNADAFSIQVKTSKNDNSDLFETTVSGTDKPSFAILISYNKKGYKISLNKALFGYMDKNDWKHVLDFARTNMSDLVERAYAKMFEV